MATPARRLLLTAAAIGLAATAFSACGSSSSGSSSTASSTPAAPAAVSTPAATTGAAATAGSDLKLAADPSQLKFDKTSLNAKAGTVTITMTNPSGGKAPHGIAVEGNGVDKDGATVQPGGTSTVTLKLKPGKYSFYCPVPGHEAAGMKGTLTVS